jgi:hypothetical protein
MLLDLQPLHRTYLRGLELEASSRARGRALEASSRARARPPSHLAGSQEALK